MTIRCAILDDYPGIALASADWSPLAGAVEVVALLAGRPGLALREAR